MLRSPSSAAMVSEKVSLWWYDFSNGMREVK